MSSRYGSRMYMEAKEQMNKNVKNLACSRYPSAIKQSLSASGSFSRRQHVPKNTLLLKNQIQLLSRSCQHASPSAEKYVIDHCEGDKLIKAPWLHWKTAVLNPQRSKWQKVFYPSDEVQYDICTSLRDSNIVKLREAH